MFLFTIGPAHLRRAHIEVASLGAPQIDQQVVEAKRALGQILAGDVGKRVYRVNGVVQVENEEQRAFRLAGRRLLTIK